MFIIGHILLNEFARFTTPVRVIWEESSITFIETRPLGGEHTCIIYDAGNEEKSGFDFKYTRILAPYGAVTTTLQTKFRGIAKPPGLGATDRPDMDTMLDASSSQSEGSSP